MWKKRILAFLLCLCMVIPSELATVFAQEATTLSEEATDTGSSGLGIPECVCENDNEDLTAHSDTECALKAYCIKVVAEKTASEIYADWDKYPDNVKSFMLTYMSWNAQYAYKLAELNTLISGGGSEEKPITPESIASDGTKVTLSGENLPENAGVTIETVNDATLNALFENPTYFYDIKLTNNNVMCQPSGEVNVTLDIPVAEGLDVVVYHILEDVGDILNKVNNGTAYIIEDENFAVAMPIAANAVKSAVDVDDAICIEELSSINDKVTINFDNINFNVCSFSDFIIYTVDFSYNGITFSIPGGSEILLSDLFSQFGIDKDATKATNVSFTDETLVTVERQDSGDWLLISLQAFNTVENLEIIFEDGTTLELVVTDAVHNSANDAVFTSDGGLTAQGYKNFSAVSGVNSSWSVWDGGAHQIRVYLYENDGSLIDYSYFGEHPLRDGWLTMSGNFWYEATDYEFGTGGGLNRVDFNTLSPGYMGLSSKVRRLDVKRHSLDVWLNQSYADVNQVSKFANVGEIGNRTTIIYANGVEVGRSTVLFPTFQSMSASDLNVASTYDVWKRRGDVTSNATVVVEDGVYKVYLVSQNTISFNLNGGSGSFPNQTKIYGVKLNLHSTKPAKTGYTFANWKSNYDGSTWAAGANFTPDRTDTLVAQWTPNTNTAYKIEYYKDGTLDTTVSATGTTGASIAYEADKYGDTYKFSSVSPANPTIVADGSMVVKVYYVKNTAKVTGTIDNGGEVSNPSQEIVIGQKSKEMKFTPASGYKITGVTVNNVAQTGFSETQYIYPAQTVNNAISVVVTTAPIEYTITYNSAGGSLIVSQNYAITTNITLAAAPTRNGYTFTGWKLASTVNNWTASTYSASHNVGSGKYGNITLVAQWSKDTYTISYNTDGGTAVQAQSYTITDENVTLCAVTTKAGYEFKGWVLETTVGNWAAKTYSASENVGTGKYGNVTLNAVWSPITYTITYDSNGGSTVPSQDYTTTTNITLSPAPTKAGYTFNGWHPEPTVGSWTASSYTAGANIGTGQYGNVSLVAQWTQTEHTAEAVAGTGISGTSGGGEYHYNDSVTFTATAAVGYILDGWYNGETKISDNASYTFRMPDSDVSYTAKASLQTYNITYDLDGGEDPGNPTSYTVTSDAITLKNPTKTGYTFTGWSGTDLPGEENKNVTIPSGSTGDRSYIAHWQINSYTVTGIIDRGTVNNVVATDTNPYKQAVNYGYSGEKMTFTPATGYEISSITINDVDQTVSNKEIFEYTPTNVVENIEVVVSTIPKKYKITWNLKYPDDAVKTYFTQVDVPFGSDISSPKVSVENYVFSEDWQVTSPEVGEVPDTMPNNDLVIQGSLVFNGGSLTITKSGMEAGKSTVFNISGDGLSKPISVTIEGSGSVTINYLPVGTYIVKEEIWSWEHFCVGETPLDSKVDGIATVEISKGSTANVTFNNQKKTSLGRWLSGEFRKNNKFGAVSNN